MDTEFEPKFYPVDKDKFREKLKSVGAKLTIPERKMFRFIADRQANNFLNKSDYIRVRNEGNVIRLSYKRTANESGKLSDQKEIDVEVSDYYKTVELLKLIRGKV